MKRLIKKFFPFLLLLASLIIVFMGDSRTITTDNYSYLLYSDISSSGGHTNGSSSSSSSIFNIQQNDVIVLLHIPGTGTSTFSQSLVKDLVTESPCSCPTTKTRCSCKNKDGNPWLFQSYNSTGFVCGENADWTTLTNCPIDQWMFNVGHDDRKARRYWMISFLREPAARFIQEWHNLVTRDAYFRNEPRLFRSESVELQKKELPCLVGKRIATLTAKDFLDCKHNPARNRMTRMLANLTEVDRFGYYGDKYDAALLESAIRNLEQLPFFGISEKPRETQALLRATLGLKFARPLNFLPTSHYKPIREFNLSANLVRSIRLANNLDVRVYHHALRLFDRQLDEIKILSPSSFSLDEEVDVREDAKADEKEWDEELSLNWDNNPNAEDDTDDEGNEDYDDDGVGDDDHDDDDDDDEEEEEEEEEDQESVKSDERHEKKLNVDESVLDFSVKKEDVEHPVKSGVLKVKPETVEKGEQGLKKRYLDGNDDEIISDDEVDDFKRDVSELWKDFDEDFYEVNEKEEVSDSDSEKELLKNEFEDFEVDEMLGDVDDDEEENAVVQSKKNTNVIFDASGKAIVKSDDEKNTINGVNYKVSVNVNFKPKSAVIDSDDDNIVTSPDDQRKGTSDDADSSKTNRAAAKDTKDVNEFFSMLAESKKKQKQQQ